MVLGLLRPRPDAGQRPGLTGEKFGMEQKLNGRSRILPCFRRLAFQESLRAPVGRSESIGNAAVRPIARHMHEAAK